MTTTKPVHITQHLPDGRAFGMDDDGVAYIGSPVEVAAEDLDVETVLTDDPDDGPGFERTTSYQGQILGRGVETKKGFMRAQKAGLEGTMPDEEIEAELEARWQKLVEVERHNPSSALGSYTVWNWQEV